MIGKNRALENSGARFFSERFGKLRGVMNTPKRARMGREILFLCLPIVAFFGYAYYQRQRWIEEAPPEILTTGKPRVVVGKWKALEPSEFDLYRGYEQKWEVPLWIGGEIKPQKFSGNQFSEAYQSASAGYLPLHLVYLKNGKWRRVQNNSPDLEVTLGEGNENKDLRGRLKAPLSIRFWNVPKDAEDLALQGKFGARVADREVTANGDSLIDSQTFKSLWTSRRISRPKTQPINRKSPFVLRQQIWKFGGEQYSLPVEVCLGFDWLEQIPVENLTNKVSVFGAVLLDADGKVVKHRDGHSWGISLFPETTDKTPPLVTNVHFYVTPQEFKRWKKPLTFQGAISFGGKWPAEVSVLLGEENKVTKPQKSRFRFDKNRVKWSEP